MARWSEVVRLYVHPGSRDAVSADSAELIWTDSVTKGEAMIGWTLRVAETMLFTSQRGAGDEAMEIEIGEACYPGAGFVFWL